MAEEASMSDTGWLKWGMVASVAAVAGAGLAYLWDHSRSLSEESSKKLLREYEDKANQQISARQAEMRAADDEALLQLKLSFARKMASSKTPKEVERSYKDAVRSYKTAAEARDADFAANVKLFYARLYNEALRKERALKPSPSKRPAVKPVSVEKVEEKTFVPTKGPLAGRRVHAVPRALLPAVASPSLPPPLPPALEALPFLEEPVVMPPRVVVEEREVRKAPDVEVIRVRRRLMLPEWTPEDIEAARDRAQLIREAEIEQEAFEERVARAKLEAERRRGSFEEVEAATNEMRSLEDMKADAMATMRANPAQASSDLAAIRELQRDLSRKVYRGFGGQDTKEIFKRVFGVDVEDPKQRGE